MHNSSDPGAPLWLGTGLLAAQNYFAPKFLRISRLAKNTLLGERSQVAKVLGYQRDWFKSLLLSFRSQFFSPDFSRLIRVGIGLCLSTLLVRFRGYFCCNAEETQQH